jgi:hypothetical protein
MKKSLVCLIIILVLATCALPVIAVKEGNGVHADITIAAAKTQADSSGEIEKKNGADDAVTVTPTTRDTLDVSQRGKESEVEDNGKSPGRNISQIRDDHDKSHESLNATLRNVSASEQENVKNTNEVRLAVHTLLELESFSGGIGHNVSEIAREFNNSASSSKTFEDRIRNRNAITRLFFGGDRDAARELANLTAQNKARIAELNQLMTGTSLDPEVRAVMEDQVRIMEKEQERLEQLSKHEQEDRGFFGWLG